MSDDDSGVVHSDHQEGGDAAMESDLSDLTTSPENFSVYTQFTTRRNS